MEEVKDRFAFLSRNKAGKIHGGGDDDGGLSSQPHRHNSGNCNCPCNKNDQISKTNKHYAWR
jgi:hypothetical protein